MFVMTKTHFGSNVSVVLFNNYINLLQEGSEVAGPPFVRFG